MPERADEERLRELLRALRVEAGVQQRELAERLGKPQSFVSKFENGERRLRFVEVAAICRALDVSLAEFVRRFERGAPLHN